MNDHQRTRIHGLKLVGIGAVLAGAFVIFLVIDARHGRKWYGPGLGIPGIPLLVGLLELVSGRSFASLARAWDDLAGWQRFVFGVVIVALASIAFIAIAGTIATILM